MYICNFFFLYVYYKFFFGQLVALGWGVALAQGLARLTPGPAGLTPGPALQVMQSTSKTYLKS